jgi:hypothetical protein
LRRRRRDAFPPGPGALVADLYPEVLGKRFPSNSGIVPMTAGHVPV